MTITIVEVGPRDGLQNEAVVVDTHTKVEFINRCVAAGVQRIEAASFVNPKRVPQMADGEAVLERLTPDAASYIGLVLNERGFDRAVNTQVDEVNLVVMVTDTFSQKNQGMTTQEAMAAVAAIAPRAKQAGLPVSVTLSASFGCPYEGEVAVSRLVDVATQVADAGIDELAIADTIGVAVPRDVQRRLSAVADAVDVPLRVHVHNTRNTGYASALAAADAGVTVLDASLGGIGGCPFAPAPRATSPPKTSCSRWSAPATTPAWTSTRCVWPASGSASGWGGPPQDSWPRPGVSRQRDRPAPECGGE